MQRKINLELIVFLLADSQACVIKKTSKLKTISIRKRGIEEQWKLKFIVMSKWKTSHQQYETLFRLFKKIIRKIISRFFYCLMPQKKS